MALGIDRDLLRRMKTIKSPICPILQEPCDRIEFKASDLSGLEAKVGKLEDEISSLEETTAEQETLQSSFQNYARKLSQVDVLKSVVDGDSVSRQVQVNQEKIESLNSKLLINLRPISDSIKSQDAEIESQTRVVSLTNQRIGELKTRIKRSLDALAKVDEVSRRSEELRKELEDLNYVVFMFSRNGIPANEIENAFGAVQDNVNYILDGMGTGFNIAFSPDRETTKWEPVCHCGFVFPKGYRNSVCQECETPRQKQRKNEISIEVTEGDEVQDFAMDSGGGKTIVSYAVRIGITMLKRDQSKNKLSVLFLDELDSALDPYFVNQLVGSITKVLTQKLGFQQILMVSHKSTIRDAVPDILQVNRHEDKTSTLEWV